MTRDLYSSFSGIINPQEANCQDPLGGKTGNGLEKESCSGRKKKRLQMRDEMNFLSAAEAKQTYQPRTQE